MPNIFQEKTFWLPVALFGHCPFVTLIEHLLLVRHHSRCQRQKKSSHLLLVVVGVIMIVAVIMWLWECGVVCSASSSLLMFLLIRRELHAVKLRNVLHPLILFYLGRGRGRSHLVLWLNLEGKINLACLSLILLSFPFWMLAVCKTQNVAVFLHAAGFKWKVYTLKEGHQHCLWLGGLAWWSWLMFTLWRPSCLQI